MIFASLGTHNVPFTRMAKAVDDFAATSSEEVIIQTGYTKYDYKHAKHFDFCTKAEMQEYMDHADILILQGGWGAISEAISQGKRCIAIPRIERVEHSHDQIQIVRKLDSLGCIIGVFDELDLPNKITQAYTHDFKPLQKGRAENIIEAKLVEWFK